MAKRNLVRGIWAATEVGPHPGFPMAGPQFGIADELTSLRTRGYWASFSEDGTALKIIPPDTKTNKEICDDLTAATGRQVVCMEKEVR